MKLFTVYLIIKHVNGEAVLKYNVLAKNKKSAIKKAREYYDDDESIINITAKESIMQDVIFAGWVRNYKTMD